MGDIANLGNVYGEAQSIKAQGEYQRMISDTNAQYARMQADDAIARGEKDAKEHETKTKGMIGSQRASLAAQGIDVNTGSAVDVQADTAAMGAADALKIKNNAWREAWGYKVQASQSAYEGHFAHQAAQNKARQTLITGGMKAATSAGNFAMGKGF